MRELARRGRWIIFLALSFISATRTNEIEIMENDNAKDSASVVKFEPVACVSDVQVNRTFRDMYLNLRHKIDWKNWWPDMSPVIEACARGAAEKRYTYFGIEFYGECWGDTQGPDRYLMNGPSLKCENGIGKEYSLQVYKITKAPELCVVGGAYFEIGDKIESENPCKDCFCRQGGRVKCHNKTCPRVPSYCEKKERPPGQCCQVCACYHNHQELSDGDTWSVYLERSCAECRCIAGTAECQRLWCPYCSSGSVKKPDSCCPECVSPRPALLHAAIMQFVNAHKETEEKPFYT